MSLAYGRNAVCHAGSPAPMSAGILNREPPPKWVLDMISQFGVHRGPLIEVQTHTVDGRNPAPFRNHRKPLFVGIYQENQNSRLSERWCKMDFATISHASCALKQLKALRQARRGPWCNCPTRSQGPTASFGSIGCWVCVLEGTLLAHRGLQGIQEKRLRFSRPPHFDNVQLMFRSK